MPRPGSRRLVLRPDLRGSGLADVRHVTAGEGDIARPWSTRPRGRELNSKNAGARRGDVGSALARTRSCRSTLHPRLPRPGFSTSRIVSSRRELMAPRSTVMSDSATPWSGRPSPGAADWIDRQAISTEFAHQHGGSTRGGLLVVRTMAVSPMTTVIASSGVPSIFGRDLAEDCPNALPMSDVPANDESRCRRTGDGTVE